MEVLVAEVDVDGCELGLSTEDDCAAEVPGEDAVIPVAGKRLVLAVRMESLLRYHLDKLVYLVICLLVQI